MIQQLQLNQLHQVVVLHQRVLGDTFNAQVGDWFLEYLYRQLLQQPYHSVVMVALEADQVVGFISATTNYAALNAQLMQTLTWQQRCLVAWFIATHPWLLAEFIRQRFFARYIQRTITPPIVSILTLGVDPHQQGKGVGQQLMNALVAELQRRKVAAVYLDTKTSNVSAIRFYERYGFRRCTEQFGTILFTLSLAE